MMPDALPDFLCIDDARPTGTPTPSAPVSTGPNPCHTPALQPKNPGPPNFGDSNCNDTVITDAENISASKNLGAQKFEPPSGFVPPIRGASFPPPPEMPDDPRPAKPVGRQPIVTAPLETTDMVPGFSMVPSVETEPDYHAVEDPKERVFLRVLEKTGRLSVAAEAAGLSESKIRRRKEKDEEFSKLMDQALSYRKEV